MKWGTTNTNAEVTRLIIISAFTYQAQKTLVETTTYPAL
jgi:hypothetical protein